MNFRPLASRRPAAPITAVLAVGALACAASFAYVAAALPAAAAPDAAGPVAPVAERVILAPTADAARGMTVTFRTAEQGASVEYRGVGGGEAASAEPTSIPAGLKGMASAGGFHQEIGRAHV